MILSCNSCEKKFVVPDQAITAAGRIVQCGSCGNKWRQFPIKDQAFKTTFAKKNNAKKISSSPKLAKPKKTKTKKAREISLYSPEYLRKKHGISITNVENNKKTISNEKTSFGFYNYLILFIVIFIAFSKSLHFFQDYMVEILPFTSFYLDYFFESIRNIFAIWKNLISSY